MLFDFDMKVEWKLAKAVRTTCDIVELAKKL